MKIIENQLPALTLDVIKQRQVKRKIAIDDFEHHEYPQYVIDGDFFERVTRQEYEETAFLLDLIERLTSKAKGFNDRLSATPPVQPSGEHPTE